MRGEGKEKKEGQRKRGEEVARGEWERGDGKIRREDTRT